jgi:transcriptional regulator with PAS, ATPase and Fis domain
VLEEKEFVPLGGTTSVRADVRVIAASHKDIETLVAAGSFRDDLYYRLNIIKIELPPLRERREDVPLLVEHFLSRLRSVKGKDISGVAAEVMGLLMNYPFPGNVRELENILEHGYVLAKGPIIEKKHLPLDFLKKTESGSPAAFPPRLVESAEARTIQDVLQRHKGSRVAAARELGVSRATLWRKIKKFRLE